MSKDMSEALPDVAVVVEESAAVKRENQAREKKDKKKLKESWIRASSPRSPSPSEVEKTRRTNEGRCEKRQKIEEVAKSYGKTLLDSTEVSREASFNDRGASEGRTSKARNGSLERASAATPEPEVVIRIMDMTGDVGLDESEMAEKQRKAEKKAKKAEKSAAKEREKLEKQRLKDLKKQQTKEKREKSKDRVDVVESADITKAKKEKIFTTIDLTEAVRDSGLEESPVQTRSPSQPFSPITKSEAAFTSENLEQSERQSRSRSPGETTGTTLTVESEHETMAKRSPSALSEGRSKSPTNKTVVDLYEKVTKESNLSEGGPSRDEVDLYETPWLPLNREEDFEISTWNAQKKSEYDGPALIVWFCMHTLLFFGWHFAWHLCMSINFDTTFHHPTPLSTSTTATDIRYEIWNFFKN